MNKMYTISELATLFATAQHSWQGEKRLLFAAHIAAAVAIASEDGLTASDITARLSAIAGEAIVAFQKNALMKEAHKRAQA